MDLLEHIGKRERETERETETERERQRQRERDRERETETERQRQTEREAMCNLLIHKFYLTIHNSQNIPHNSCPQALRL